MGNNMKVLLFTLWQIDVLPHAVGKISHVGETEDYGNDEQRLVFSPAYRLLMPESSNNTEYAQADAQYI